MSAESTVGNPFCQLQCPNVNLCSRAILRGEMWQAGGDPQALDELLGIEDIEQDTVDGVYTEADAIRIVTLAAPIASDDRNRMREAGEALSRGFTGLRSLLMETCTQGPEEIDGQLICRSEQVLNFRFTEDDLR